MRTRTIALALAVMVAIGSGGVLAASSAGPGADGVSNETTNVDGYEFAVTDHDGWLDGDDTDPETVPELAMADDAVADLVRDAFDADEPLQVDVYGSLVRDADSAHVRITPASVGDDEPAKRVLVLTVDLEDGSVDVVGADADPDEESATRLDADDSKTYVVERTDDGESDTGSFTVANGSDGDAGSAEAIRVDLERVDFVGDGLFEVEDGDSDET